MRSDLTPEIHSTLRALADVETRYSAERDSLGQWSGPRALKERLLAQLEARHARERLLVQRLADLQQQMTSATMFAAIAYTDRVVSPGRRASGRVQDLGERALFWIKLVLGSQETAAYASFPLRQRSPDYVRTLFQTQRTSAPQKSFRVRGRGDGTQPRGSRKTLEIGRTADRARYIFLKPLPCGTVGWQEQRGEPWRGFRS